MTSTLQPVRATRGAALVDRPRRTRALHWRPDDVVAVLPRDARQRGDVGRLRRWKSCALRRTPGVDEDALAATRHEQGEHAHRRVALDDEAVRDAARKEDERPRRRTGRAVTALERELSLEDVKVRSDSVVGYSTSSREWRTFPVGSVASIERRGVSAGRTAAVVVGTAAVGAVVIYGLAYASFLNSVNAVPAAVAP